MSGPEFTGRLLVLFLLVVSAVHALTVSPASHSFDAHPGLEEYSVTVRNDEAQPLSISLTPTGALADAITLPDAFTLQPGASTSVLVRIAVPEQTQPGVLESGVRFESHAAGGGTVAASSAVQHVIRLRTPYEGLHLDANLLFPTAQLGQPVTVTIALRNTGTLPITRANATVQIAGAQTETLSTPGVALAPGEVADVRVTFTPQQVGVYSISGVISYDGGDVSVTGSITVGDYSVAIDDLQIGDFRLGDPFRVTTTAINLWGDALPVTVITEVVQNASIARGQSTSTMLQPLAHQSIPVFIESRSLTLGPAELTTMVNFGTTTVRRSMQVVVGVDSLRPVGATPVKWWWVAVCIALIGGIFAGWGIMRHRRSA